ncbi:hypothetical protein C9374_009228 [Naegleria lovaniensis]|uniref:Threonine/serine exporter-like N-terminal domain-containing protein n=1 Tax=Naegleria lovaniensis TaxID=51637 RepID=A0AA88GDA4_NAELO|nr:uncharacterized protein C9374_009228 [Naegleria lovaniensis]KAG2377317.1 hypothetical protein C9374_009228 [Naegleria lovaniensis]
MSSDPNSTIVHINHPLALATTDSTPTSIIQDNKNVSSSTVIVNSNNNNNNNNKRKTSSSGSSLPKTPIHISSSDADESESAEESSSGGEFHDANDETKPMLSHQESPSKRLSKKSSLKHTTKAASSSDVITNSIPQPSALFSGWFGSANREENQPITPTRSEGALAKKGGPKWWWLEIFNNNEKSSPTNNLLDETSLSGILPSDSFKRNSLTQLEHQKEVLEERVRMINSMMQRMKETKKSLKQKRSTTPLTVPLSKDDAPLDGVDSIREDEEANSSVIISTDKVYALGVPSQQNKKLRKKKLSNSNTSSLEKLSNLNKKKNAHSVQNESENSTPATQDSITIMENPLLSPSQCQIDSNDQTQSETQKKGIFSNVFDNYFTKSFKNIPVEEGQEKLPSDRIFSKDSSVTDLEEGNMSKIVVDETQQEQVIGTSYSTLYDYERQVQLILIDLGYALATYGVPAHRLEYHLTYISKQFGVKPCQIEYTSTGLLFSFSDPIDWAHYNVENGKSTSTTLYITIDNANLSSTGGSINLDKLYQLDKIAEELAARTITIPDARKRIRKVIRSKPIFNHFGYQIATHLLNTFAWVVFLDGSILEMITSCVIGAMVGVFCTLADRYPYFHRVNSVINSVAAGLVATILKIIFAQFTDPVARPLSVFLVTLCGVFSILPAIQFTTGIAELSTRHLLSGSVRLFSGFIATLQLGFGVLMATGIDNFLSNSTTIFAHNKPDKFRNFNRVAEWILALVLPLIIISNIFTFRVPKKILTYLFVGIISYISFFVTTVSAHYLGTEVGALLGALVCGIIGNLYALITRNPGLLVTVCGTVLLIPAAFGVRGVKDFLASNSGNETSLISGIEFVFNLLSITVSVSVGLLLGDFIVPVPRKLSF